MVRRALLFAGALVVFAASLAQASEPGWSSQVILFGQAREEIRSTNILDRPYRPLHFYGNAVRRRYYRGSAFALRR